MAKTLVDNLDIAGGTSHEMLVDALRKDLVHYRVLHEPSNDKGYAKYSEIEVDSPDEICRKYKGSNRKVFALYNPENSRLNFTNFSGNVFFSKGRIIEATKLVEKRKPVTENTQDTESSDEYDEEMERKIAGYEARQYDRYRN